MFSKEHSGRDSKAAAERDLLKTPARDAVATAERANGAAAAQRAIVDPGLLSPLDVLHLQRTIGNQAVQRLLTRDEPDGPRLRHDGSHTNIRAKLTVGAAGDVYEREADRVSEQVMGMPETRVQRSCECGGDCPTCQSEPQVRRLVQTEGEHAHGDGAIAAPPVVDEVLSTPGQPLDEVTRAFMEPRFNQDFGGVRVHTDPAAVRSAESVGARAYTAGNHVVFGEGQYRPGTSDGRRLLAHELTHVAQQGAAPPSEGGVVQRDKDKDKDKAPAKGAAAAAPKQLELRPAKNSPPCGCIVFMHHNEANARLTAQLMYEFCRYNLAIVSPEGTTREIKGTKIDPNELFPRDVAEQCWDDDKPCEEFMSKSTGAAKSGEPYLRRQFFLTIKKCSDGFSLPVISLHNNDIAETKRYRAGLKDTAKPLDPTPVRGKTVDSALKPGEKSGDANTMPLAELNEWLMKNVPNLVEDMKAEAEARAKKKDPPVHLLTKGKTNIFLWCRSGDISACHIGDPERPDSVAWVTNHEDFKKLQGTKTNVVLQTKVDPKGKSTTDLSSLFVFLQEIIGVEYAKVILKLLADAALDVFTIALAIDALQRLQESGEAAPEGEAAALGEIITRVMTLIRRLQSVADKTGELSLKLSQLRFINIETPQTATDPATKPEDLRVQGFRDVRDTLALLGLDCCDTKAAEGETESPVEKIEAALRKGKMPEAAAK